MDQLELPELGFCEERVSITRSTPRRLGASQRWNAQLDKAAGWKGTDRKIFMLIFLPTL